MTERTLFDSSGTPIAYIVDDGSIYLWSGEATTYLDSSGRLYGWNGRHLGNFTDGIVYDQRGQRIGFERHRCPSVTHAEPVKSVKSVRRVRSVRNAASVTPVRSLNNSPGLKALLEQGR